jgi:hypothetical protein
VAAVSKGIRDDVAGLVMVALGTVALQMAVSGDSVYFVKPVMTYPLGAAARSSWWSVC